LVCAAPGAIKVTCDGNVNCCYFFGTVVAGSLGTALGIDLAGSARAVAEDFRREFIGDLLHAGFLPIWSLTISVIPSSLML
jgi:hypothetical protein